MSVENRIAELEHLAYHDPLTGLLNRNWLNKYLPNFDHKFVYFIDINNLREINKQGHTMGDAHIKLCARDADSRLNTGDLLIRYAGDEFVALSELSGVLNTNGLYTVGVVMRKKYEHILGAIERADQKMIAEKRR